MKTTYTFKNCHVHVDTDNSWTCTRYLDGTEVPATPHYDTSYKYWADYCGYGEDVAVLSREHEISHTFLSEKLGREYSYTLWDVAHGVTPEGERLDLHTSEEGLVLAFQRYLNTGEVRSELEDYPDYPTWAEEFKRNYR